MYNVIKLLEVPKMDKRQLVDALKVFNGFRSDITFEVEKIGEIVSIFFIPNKNKRFFREKRSIEGIARIRQFLRSLGLHDSSIEEITDSNLPFIINECENLGKFIPRKYRNVVISFKGIPSGGEDRNLLDEYIDIIMSNEIEYSNLQITFRYQNPKRVKTHSKRFKGEERNHLRISEFQVSAKVIALNPYEVDLKKFLWDIKAFANSFNLKTKAWPRFWGLIRSPLLSLKQRKHIRPSMLSSLDLSSYLQLPKNIHCGLNATSSFEGFSVPPVRDITTIQFPIGFPIVNGIQYKKPFSLTKKDLFQHVGIWGRTGSGKTRLSIKLIESLLKTGSTVCVFDLKGDYYPLLELHDPSDLAYLKPGSSDFGFGLNPFEVPKFVHIRDHFVFLFETFRALIKSGGEETSGQMEELLESAIKKTIGQKGDFHFFIDLLTNRANDLGIKGAYIEKSGQAVASRIKRLTRGVGGIVLQFKNNTIDIEELLKTSIIFDLSALFKKGGEGYKFVTEILFYLISNAMMNLKGPISDPNEIGTVFVFEETQLIAPERRKGDPTSIFGYGASTLRGYGARLIFSGTTPKVEEAISDNTALNIYYEVPKELNLSKGSMFLPEQVAIIHLPYWNPFLLKVYDVILPKVTERTWEQARQHPLVKKSHERMAVSFK